MNARMMLVAGGCLMLAAATGCESEEELIPIHPASGRVRLASGEPVGPAIITFHRPDESLLTGVGTPRGETDADGRFTLTTYRSGDGAPAGEYRVTIYWPKSGSLDADPLAPDRLGKKYARRERTPLTATVPEGGSDQIHLEVSR